MSAISERTIRFCNHRRQSERLKAFASLIRSGWSLQYSRLTLRKTDRISLRDHSSCDCRRLAEPALPKVSCPASERRKSGLWWPAPSWPFADAPVICVLATLLVGGNPQGISSPGKGLAFLMPCDYIGSKVLKALSVFISRDSRLIKRKV